MKLYVVTAPESIRGIYETWPACQTAVSGVLGARFQAVRSRAEAEALLSGDGVRLDPGLYAFVDGNHDGGVGVVLITQRKTGPPTVTEISTTVRDVFTSADLPGLSTAADVGSALARLRNVLAELAGLYVALRRVGAATAPTIVHDYEGIGAWLTGRWHAKDPTVGVIIEACRHLIEAKRLAVTFRYQPAHQGLAAGRHDFAFYNQRADALARQAR